MGTDSRRLAGSGIVAVGLNLGSSSSSDAEVSVEEADVSSLQASHVHLDELAAGKNVRYGEEHVDELGNAELARLSDLDHGDRLVRILELVARGANLRPNLSVESKALSVSFLMWPMLIQSSRGLLLTGFQEGPQWCH